MLLNRLFQSNPDDGRYGSIRPLMLQMRAHNFQHSLIVGEPGRAAGFKVLQQTFVSLPTDVVENDSIGGGPVSHDGHTTTLIRGRKHVNQSPCGIGSASPEW